MNKEKAFFIVVIFSFLVSFFVAKIYIPKAIVGWDEAGHTYNAYRIYADLRKLDFYSFLKDTFTQIHYPPLQSWFYGFPFLLIGFSFQKARIISLSWFILGSLLLFFVGLEMDKKKGVIIGLISSFLLLLSPMALLFSGLALKEMMGATLTLLTIFTYFRARKNNTPFFYLLVSLLLFALTLTKYNYGTMMITAILLEGTITFLLSKSRRNIFFSHLLIFIPFLFLFGVWLIFPYNKISLFLNVISNRFMVTQGMANLWQYFLFYPRAIIYMYSPSILMGIILILSFIFSLKYFKNFQVRLLWLVVVLNLFSGFIYTWNMQERYIFTSMPPLFLLGAFSLVNLLPGILVFKKRPFLAGILLAVFIFSFGKILLDLLHLPNYVYSMAAYTLKLPAFNQTDYDDKKLWFNYLQTTWPKQLPDKFYEKPIDLLDFVASSVDLTKPIKIIGYANEFSPDYFNIVFALHQEKKDFITLPYSSFIVTLEYSSTSRFGTRDEQRIYPYQIEEIRAIEQDKSLTLLEKKIFNNLGIEVVIYGKK